MQKKSNQLLTQSLLVLLSILLIGSIYNFGVFGNSQNLKKSKTPTQSKPSLTWSQIENQAVGGLKNSDKKEYQQIANIKDPDEQFDMKSSFWQKEGHFELFGHEMYKKAKLENTEKSITFATRLLIEIIQRESSPQVSSLLADDIMDLTSIGLRDYPQSDDWEVYQAQALIDGKDETMSGVQKLLAVTKKDPNNLQANLILGRLALKSQQYDKGIDRLEKLVKVYPDNSEAMFFLAEAYKGKGDKANAIKWFEKCKNLVNNADFSKEIDGYINSFD